MNNREQWLPIRDKHYKIISEYYPDFEKDKMKNIKINDNTITFEYEGVPYICQNISQYQKSLQTLYKHTGDLVNSLLWEHIDPSSLSSGEIIDIHDFKLKNIISFYFKNLPHGEIKKMYTSNGYIIIHHNETIKLCPEALPGKNYWESSSDMLTQWIEISLVIQSYYPDITNIDEIENLITFDGNKILFTYQGCQYFCDMYSIEQILAQVKKAKEKEDLLVEILSKPIKPDLRIIHSQKQ